jgi:hypothetical protein
VEERTKKVSFIGTFGGISANRFPALAPPFSVVAPLTDGLGDATADLVVVALSTGDEAYTFRSQLHFPDKLAEVLYHARLRQCSFPAPGDYQFTLLIDGEWVAQRRVRIHQKEEES